MAGAPAGVAARFSCPPNFTVTPPASSPARLSLEALTGPDTELWLIQAPSDFSPDCLNGRLVPLSGSQVVKGKSAGKRHRYRVLGSSGAPAGEATLLAPSAEAGGGLICAPAPQGSLRILDGPQGPLSGTPLQSIPMSPPPQIPPGLRPRFCAFGGSPPVTGPLAASALRPPALVKRKKKRHVPEALVPQEAVDGPGTLDTALEPPEMSERKKKKRQQLSALEVMEPVAREPEADMLEPLGGLLPSTTKRKKKKPKEAYPVKPEIEVLEPEQMVKLETVVKTEPLEEIVLSPKKKKKEKGAEEVIVEETIVESQFQVKMEPQEEPIPLPSSNKKKERGLRVMTEPGTVTLKPETSPMELRGEMMEPVSESQAEAALGPTKKRRKKEKEQNTAMESGIEETEPRGEVAEPVLSDVRESGDILAVTKKKKRKGRGHTVTEPQGEGMELELQDHGEPEAGPALGASRRRDRGQESAVPETAPQEEVPESLLTPESGEVVPTKREKKRKKQPRQDPM